MKIIIDSREQTPWQFPADIETTPGSLPTGDYSLAGFERAICCERKELSDFIACCGPERQRFEEELVRMRGYKARAVIIEGTLGNILRHEYRSKIEPGSIVGSMAAWSQRHQIPFFLADDRNGGATMCLSFLRNFLRTVEAEHKALRQQMTVVEVLEGAISLAKSDGGKIPKEASDYV